MPAHRSRQTVAFLHLHVPEFVEPENWPPNSPDLNPVEYSIWEHLKEVLQTCWEQIGQDVIGQSHKRLSLVVATGGGPIEHRFD